jgi:hypothetical protein
LQMQIPTRVVGHMLPAATTQGSIWGEA